MCCPEPALGAWWDLCIAEASADGRRTATRDGLKKTKLNMRRIRAGDISLACALLFDLQRSFWICCRISSCACQPPASASRSARCSGDNLFCGAAVGWGNPHFCLFCACGCIYLSAHKGLSSPSCIAGGIGFQLAASGSGGGALGREMVERRVSCVSLSLTSIRVSLSAGLQLTSFLARRGSCHPTGPLFRR